MLAALALLATSYTDLKIEGWTIRVESALLASEAWKPVERELSHQLYRIARTVPDEPLQKIRQVTVWVHRENKLTPGMAFHPNPQWLKEHQLNPEMAGHVEIGNVTNFPIWTHTQPWMVMHEMAHAYHFRFLEKGFENAEIKRRFEEAMKEKGYESVLHHQGHKTKHYGCNNQMEFFAEATEAYFGQNDFYPFVNAELKTFDPGTYKLLQTIWGTPVHRAKTN